MTTEVHAEHVIVALREALSDAQFQIALLKAQQQQQGNQTPTE